MPQERHVVCAMIIDRLWRVLLQDRTNRSKYGEKWSFFGGGIDGEETPSEALVRELSEELDWDIRSESVHFLGKTHHVIASRDMAYHRDIFLIRTKRPENSFVDKEASGAKFFMLSEARTLEFNTDTQEEFDLVEKYLQTNS